jgi:hypothetical protein
MGFELIQCKPLVMNTKKNKDITKADACESIRTVNYSLCLTEGRAFASLHNSFFTSKNVFLMNLFF